MVGKMSPRRLALPLALLATLCGAAGCGEQQGDAAPETTRGEVVFSVSMAPEADPNAPLPPGACFEAAAGYTLALVVHGGAPPGFCERLARFLPPDAGHAAWPMPPSHHQDENTPTLECTVARDRVRVEVLTWPLEESGPDPYEICRDMVRSGWEVQPLFHLGEVGGPDAEPGTCFVATERYEVALTGETERGQALCEEVAKRHLPATIAHRAIPAAYPDSLGDTVCEASRAGDRLQLVSMPGDRGAVDLPAVCDSLERAGWDVNRYERN